MAVAFDASSESHTGTVGSIDEASFSWSHNPVGTPAGVVVFVYVRGTTVDLVGSVTYGGTTMTAVPGGRAVDTADGTGSCKAHFLGVSVPTDDPATVVVNRTNNSTTLYAIAITVTAIADTETTGVLLEQEDQALTEENIDDGSLGTDSIRVMGLASGRGNVPAAGANSTTMQSIDFGSRTMAAYRETAAGQGSRPVGASAVSDDVAAVYFAIREPAVVGHDYLAAIHRRQAQTLVPVLL